MDESGDISISPPSGQAAEQKHEPSKEAMEASERKYYEEEEKNVAEASWLSLELLEKVKLEGADIMTFKLSRSSCEAKMDYAPGQLHFSSWKAW